MKTGGLGVKANAVHIYHLIHVTVDRRIAVIFVIKEIVVAVFRTLECTLLPAPIQRADVFGGRICRDETVTILRGAVHPKSSSSMHRVTSAVQ